MKNDTYPCIVNNTIYGLDIYGEVCTIPHTIPTPKNLKIFATDKERIASEYNLSPETRNTVITRDKGLCVNCGNKGTEVHHLIPKTKLNFKLYGDKINSQENLILVCKDCHNKHSLFDMPLRAELKARWKANSKINKL